MSRLTILNTEEIKLFDKPPRFTEEQQHKYFSLTPQLLELIEKLRTSTNQVCMMVHWGYFRATGRFFMPKDFRIADLHYVCDTLDIDKVTINLEDYCQKPKVSRDHERRILKIMDFIPFDQGAKIRLQEQIEGLAQKNMQPREIIYFLSSQLHQQKI